MHLFTTPLGSLGPAGFKIIRSEIEKMGKKSICGLLLLFLLKVSSVVLTYKLQFFRSSLDQFAIGL